MRHLILLLFSLAMTAAHAQRISNSFKATSMPKSWFEKPISGEVEILDSLDFLIRKEAIQKALSKYPDQLLDKYLDRVYLLKRIQFYGQGYGGTYYKKSLFIAHGGEALGYTNFFVEQSVHHEFSSILWQENKDLFNEKKWIKKNKAKYGKGGIQALLDSSAGQKFDQNYNKLGFITQYAQSSLENDINCLAENLFLPKPNFYSILKKNRILKRKWRLLIHFYRKIDRSLNRKYFKLLRVNPGNIK